MAKTFRTLVFKSVGQEGPQSKEIDMKMEMEMKVLVGADSKAFLVELAKQIDRLETLLGGVTKKAQGKHNDDAKKDEDDEDEDEDEEFSGKKQKKKSSFEEDEDEEEADEDEDADEEEEDEKPKKSKAKKITVDDVNDACKAKAAATGGKKGRAEVLAILKKKFGTESVSELKPEQYAKAIAAMDV